MDDRRRFERVRLPDSAQVFVLDAEGKRIGRVRLIGIGGLLIETQQQFLIGSPLKVTLVDEGARIHREVILVARYRSEEGAGFEFRALDTDAAVEIGIILGRYYAAAHSAHA